jgi:hypothetical protein
MNPLALLQHNVFQVYVETLVLNCLGQKTVPRPPCHLTFLPNSGAVGSSHFKRGPRKPAAAAVINVFTSVSPLKYRARVAAAEARNQVSDICFKLSTPNPFSISIHCKVRLCKKSALTSPSPPLNIERLTVQIP